ncbi:MAG: DUF4129 domain-containing protein [Chloroflexi bacterium]|nr:DUF4129 domain-containing protein [Chloroflexota bacterium]
MAPRRAPVLALLLARCGVEAVTFASLAAVCASFFGARDPLSVTQGTLVVLGIALALVAVLREARADRAQRGLVVAGVLLPIAFALLLPTRPAIETTVHLGRAIAFGILGLCFLWRALSIARGLVRWTEVRSSGVLAAIAIAVAAVFPGVDHGSLPLIALVAVTATSIALSLARATEELELLGEDARGVPGGGSALGAAFALGVLAIVVALVEPYARAFLASAGAVAGPIAEAVLFAILLPLGYLAAFFIEALRGRISLPRFAPLAPTAEDAAREEAMRQVMDQTRPVVVGVIELIVVAVVVLFALVLVDRLMRERRVSVPQGTTLERVAASGTSLRDMLAGLLPSRRAHRRAPREDGTAAGTLRVLYWRLLVLAERAGHGWRAPEETPAEHAQRLARAEPRWSAARPLVEAFERWRYGEELPDAATLAAARAALRTLETAPSPR